MEKNLLDYYPDLTVVRRECKCDRKPFKVIIILIKLACPCWYKYHLDNIFIYDVIDLALDNFGRLDTLIHDYTPDIGIILSQTWRQKMF